jgi:NADH:ubiquinone oxidoreductase subunit 2 (subunit N)
LAAELLPFVSVAPLGAALLLLALRLMARPVSEELASGLVRAASAASTLAAALVLAEVVAGGPVEATWGPWIVSPALRVDLAWSADAVTALLALVGSALVLGATTFARPYLLGDPSFLRLHGLLALFAGSLGLIATGSSLVLVFAGWELAGLCSGLLIAYDQARPAAVAAGRRALLTNRVGDAGLLGAVVVAGAVLGTTDVDRLHELGAWSPAVGAGLLVAALAKAGQLPFTPWLERAVEGPTPTSALFYGGAMTQAGLVLVLRAAPLLDAAPLLRAAVGIAAVGTVAHAGLASLAQPDVKRRLVLEGLAGLSVAMGLAAAGLEGPAAVVGGASAVVSTGRLLLSPSWLAVRALHPLRPVPAWLAARPRWQVLAAERFHVERAGDVVAAAVVDGSSRVAEAVERRLIEPLFGAAVPALDALAGRALRDEVALEPNVVDEARGALAGAALGVARAVEFAEDAVIARGVGRLLPEGGRRVGERLARFEDALRHPAWLVAVVLASLVGAVFGGGA